MPDRFLEIVDAKKPYLEEVFLGPAPRNPNIKLMLSEEQQAALENARETLDKMDSPVADNDVAIVIGDKGLSATFGEGVGVRSNGR